MKEYKMLRLGIIGLIAVIVVIVGGIVTNSIMTQDKGKPFTVVKDGKAQTCIQESRVLDKGLGSKETVREWKCS